MALITASDYKTYTGLSGTALDAQLAVMIPIAQAQLEAMCGRPAGGFESATWTQDFDGRGGASIFVPCYPITSVTSVSSRDCDGNLTTLDADEYWISADAKAIERPGSGIRRGLGNPNTLNDDSYYPSTGAYPQFVEGNNNFRIVYVGGYASNAIPPQLKLAMYAMLDQMIGSAGQPADIKSETDGAYSYSKFGKGESAGADDPLSVQSLLAQWMSPI